MSKAIGLWCLASSLALVTVFAGDLRAQPYPTRAIQIIVPTASGGGLDMVARLTGAQLARRLGQSVVIVNRPGAGNVIGTQMAARAEPDGYTLLLANATSHGANQAFYPKLPYDTITDFTPISLIGTTPQLVVTGNSVPAKSIKEFIQLAKARPGQLNLGSGGTGAQSHLSGEMFKLVTGIEMVHIPYNGAGPALTALMTGETHIFFPAASGAIPYVLSGRLKALAVSGTKRLQVVPGVPTLSEQGITGFDTSPWYALVGPRGLPASVLTRLNREVAEIVQIAEFKQQLSALGVEAQSNSPQRMRRDHQGGSRAMDQARQGNRSNRQVVEPAGPVLVLLDANAGRLDELGHSRDIVPDDNCKLLRRAAYRFDADSKQPFLRGRGLNELRKFLVQPPDD